MSRNIDSAASLNRKRVYQSQTNMYSMYMDTFMCICMGSLYKYVVNIAAWYIRQNTILFVTCLVTVDLLDDVDLFNSLMPSDAYMRR